MPPCRGKQSSRRPAAGAMRPRNWSAWRWRWRFSFSPVRIASDLVIGPAVSRLFISRTLNSGDAPTFASADTASANPMILDIARLLLFPALMAFAAASDLFTMTISNRVSLALAAGFLALALLSGMGLYDILSHLGAGAAVLDGGLCLLCHGLDRRRRRQGRGRRRALVRLWPSAELSGLCLAVRRRPDAVAAPVPAMAAALRRSPARPGCSSCTPRTAEFPTASRSRSAR